MNNYKLFFAILFISMLAACNDDEPMNMPDTNIDPPTISFEMNQTVDIASSVRIDGSGSMGGQMLSFAWSVTDPEGQPVSIDASATTITFNAERAGSYNISLTVTDEGGNSTETGVVTVISPTYTTADQMGRPAINTVFNFFGSGDTKNAYNRTTPQDANVDAASFKGILDALQGYIGLDPAAYTNALGLDNATTASVLASDVLMSNKNFPSTYGPSDLMNISVGENVLNGRGLNDDVVDVTLILAFGGNLTNLSAIQAGLISDNVQSNDVSHSNAFPYLASAQ